MRAAPELLGALTIGGGSARPWGDDGGSPRSQISLLSCPKCTKTAKNGLFHTLFGLEVAKNAVFHSKVLNKIYSRDFFKEYINFQIFHYLSHCGVNLFKVLEVI
jgi:hypothetical protein